MAEPKKSEVDLFKKQLQQAQSNLKNLLSKNGKGIFIECWEKYKRQRIRFQHQDKFWAVQFDSPIELKIENTKNLEDDIVLKTTYQKINDEQAQIFIQKGFTPDILKELKILKD